MCEFTLTNLYGFTSICFRPPKKSGSGTSPSPVYVCMYHVCVYIYIICHSGIHPYEIKGSSPTANNDLALGVDLIIIRKHIY